MTRLGLSMNSEIFMYANPLQPSPDKGGTLSGKTFTVQQNMSVRGWPTDAGSLALKGFIAIENATIIDRMENAGAHIVGSTRISELGLGLNGDTSGLSLAEGWADIAFMTDMMGEARITASRINAYGFKPTNGMVSRFGLIGLVPSMECFGIMAKNPNDIDSVMGIIAGADDRDFSLFSGNMPRFDEVPEKGFSMNTIGIVNECMEYLNGEETRAFENGIETLKALGLEIREVSLPDFDLFRTVHHIVGSVEASSSCGKYDGVRYGHRTATAKNWNDMYLKSRAECFGLIVKTYLFQGAYFQFEHYAAFENASRIRARMVKDFDGLFTKVDVLVFPTRKWESPVATAQCVDDIYDVCSLTLPANVMGLPSMQIPGFVHGGNADLGLQIVGARMSDARLISFSARLSQSAKGV
jgi:aspartyl-tRNA(Asn)/glutamyl-tRNA(Gln) amidotransferase subunit A